MVSVCLSFRLHWLSACQCSFQASGGFRLSLSATILGQYWAFGRNSLHICWRGFFFFAMNRRTNKYLSVCVVFRPLFDFWKQFSMGERGERTKIYWRSSLCFLTPIVWQNARDYRERLHLTTQMKHEVHWRAQSHTAKWVLKLRFWSPGFLHPVSSL